ncbi:MAG: N(4)-(beta-N-acetylglucosaminyl)-L-asparaginase [Planctomycetota bacterium]|jgi:isoaspartyl peptidase/L-asparaginase-like protein (Ntn-hydrolase superfamily)
MTAILLSTWSFGLTGHAAAWPALRAGGSSVDAVETICRTIEADEGVDSVGFGGLPDRDGLMTVDASIMVGPDRAGAVAAMRGQLHPVTAARRVMEETPHMLLAGAGAETFARAHGLEETEILSARAKARWERWTRDGKIPNQGSDGSLTPIDDGSGSGVLFEEERRWSAHDTIGALAMSADGALAGACSTSGLPYKAPGRVGDSPIIGHGLYVDPRGGAATMTGDGELAMGVCGSFLAVEAMRGGRTPAEAARIVLERIAETNALAPTNQVAIIALSPDGAWCGGALRPGFRISVTMDGRNEAVRPDVVLEPNS